ncbi:MoaD/ThiS family protein [Rhodococcus qingshengii]
MVEVRYFAGAADAAGCRREEFVLDEVASLGSLTAAIIDRHGLAITDVLRVSAFLIADVLTRDPAAEIGARVDVLPPFAGG